MSAGNMMTSPHRSALPTAVGRAKKPLSRPSLDSQTSQSSASEFGYPLERCPRAYSSSLPRRTRTDNSQHSSMQLSPDADGRRRDTTLCSPKAVTPTTAAPARASTSADSVDYDAAPSSLVDFRRSRGDPAGRSSSRCRTPTTPSRAGAGDASRRQSPFTARRPPTPPMCGGGGSTGSRRYAMRSRTSGGGVTSDSSSASSGGGGGSGTLFNVGKRGNSSDGNEAGATMLPRYSGAGGKKSPSSSSAYPSDGGIRSPDRVFSPDGTRGRPLYAAQDYCSVLGPGHARPWSSSLEQVDDDEPLEGGGVNGSVATLCKKAAEPDDHERLSPIGSPSLMATLAAANAAIAAAEASADADGHSDWSDSVLRFGLRSASGGGFYPAAPAVVGARVASAKHGSASTTTTTTTTTTKTPAASREPSGTSFPSASTTPGTVMGGGRTMPPPPPPSLAPNDYNDDADAEVDLDAMSDADLRGATALDMGAMLREVAAELAGPHQPESRAAANRRRMGGGARASSSLDKDGAGAGAGGADASTPRASVNLQPGEHYHHPLPPFAADPLPQNMSPLQLPAQLMATTAAKAAWKAPEPTALPIGNEGRVVSHGRQTIRRRPVPAAMNMDGPTEQQQPPQKKHASQSSDHNGSALATQCRPPSSSSRIADGAADESRTAASGLAAMDNIDSGDGTNSASVRADAVIYQEARLEVKVEAVREAPSTSIGDASTTSKTAGITISMPMATAAGDDSVTVTMAQPPRIPPRRRAIPRGAMPKSLSMSGALLTRAAAAAAASGSSSTPRGQLGKNGKNDEATAARPTSMDGADVVVGRSTTSSTTSVAHGAASLPSGGFVSRLNRLRERVLAGRLFARGAGGGATGARRWAAGTTCEEATPGADAKGKGKKEEAASTIAAQQHHGPMTATLMACDAASARAGMLWFDGAADRDDGKFKDHDGEDQDQTVRTPEHVARDQQPNPAASSSPLKKQQPPGVRPGSADAGTTTAPFVATPFLSASKAKKATRRVSSFGFVGSRADSPSPGGGSVSGKNNNHGGASPPSGMHSLRRSVGTLFASLRLKQGGAGKQHAHHHFHQPAEPSPLAKAGATAAAAQQQKTTDETSPLSEERQQGPHSNSRPGSSAAGDGGKAGGRRSEEPARAGGADVESGEHTDRPEEVHRATTRFSVD